MRSSVLLTRCVLALALLPASTMLAQPASASAPAAAASPLANPAAYMASQFGTSFTLDPKIPPIFGDLDGDGNEDLILVATSATPLLAQELFNFRVEDPYNGYFGADDVKITSQFTLHFDGSARCILVVLGWRLPPPARKSKQPTKFVLINTPFETLSVADLQFKKKHIQAIEAVDRTTLHSIMFWDGKRWRWSAQGMEGDEPIK
jgi:hypothetical protein